MPTPTRSTSAPPPPRTGPTWSATSTGPSRGAFGPAAERHAGHPQRPGLPGRGPEELYGDLKAWFRATRVTGALDGMRLGLVTADKRYRTALAPWARCMRGKGHPYADPAASRAAATRADRPWPHAKEVRLASAEAACAASSGLADVARALNTEYRAELGRRHPRETADLARLRREALPRARAIVAREG